MKKKGILATGVAVGMLASMGIQAFAGDAVQQVTAYINDSFQFMVNGEAKTLSDGYHVLVYNDRSYLPVREISNMLGDNVQWDDTTKTITITSKNDGKTDGDGSGTVSDSRNYAALPLTKETADYRVSVTTYGKDIERNDGLMKLGIRLSSLKDGQNVRIDQSKTKYEINGVTYDYKSIDAVDRDNVWYTSYASKDSDLQGYLMLPRNIGEYSKIHMEVTVLIDTNTGQVPYALEFDMAV